MKVLKIFFISLLFIVITGCIGSDDDVGDNDKKVVTVNMGSTTYNVPADVKLVDADINGADIQMISSGSKEEVAGFIEYIGVNGNSIQSPDFLKNAQAIQKGVETVYSQLRANTSIVNSISLLSSQSFQTPYTFTVAHYQLTTVTSMQPLTLAGEIINTIAGGTASGFPVADQNAPSDTNFRFILLYGEYEGSTFYIAVVVPESLYPQYEATINEIINAARVIPKGKTLQTSTEKFTTNTGSQKADFLFVVDDSGSMGDDQDAISQAAVDFTTEMSSSGLTYRTAIITTSYGADDPVNGHAYHILRDTGIIENNDTLFREKLVAGTYGSGTETGIWNAEQSLQSVAHGDSGDGAISQLGMPQADSTLSVVIISDEPSQYRYRSGYVDFNISDNLFLDRNINVYAIIKPGYTYADTGIFDEYNSSQYDDLATVTGGIYADIENRDTNGSLDFSIIMKKIAQDAGGAASSFILTHSAAIINEVKVNGTVVSHDTVNGYTYVQSSKAIVFHGTSIPGSGATIQVTYKYYQ